MLEDADVATALPAPATASDDDRAVADSVSSGPSGEGLPSIASVEKQHGPHRFCVKHTLRLFKVHGQHLHLLSHYEGAVTYCTTLSL